MDLSRDSSIFALNPFESFCKCDEDCSCGEKNLHEWTWDEKSVTETSQLSQHNLEVKFHPGYSSGTTAIRGNKLLERGRHYYWEVKMATKIYGTDVMVGVGTEKAELQVCKKFCSLLGHNRESWGYSYKGYIKHAGESRDYAPRFGQGSIVGVYLNTWRGTLQFFLNRKPLGIAFVGLHNVDLYPMVCSTVAMSKIRIVQSSSVSASLQVDCLSMLKPLHRSYLNNAFPGLRHLVDSVFADILRAKEGDEDDDDNYVYEFPEEYMILDDFDFALVGFGKRKRRKLNVTTQSQRISSCSADLTI